MDEDTVPYTRSIKKQLIKEQLDTEGDRGLAEYIRNRILRQKVFRMFPDVEVWQGELWGVLEIESYGKLSDTELNAVIAEWSGQASDGWGEGFEQRPIDQRCADRPLQTEDHSTAPCQLNIPAANPFSLFSA